MGTSAIAYAPKNSTQAVLALLVLHFREGSDALQDRCGLIELTSCQFIPSRFPQERFNVAEGRNALSRLCPKTMLQRYLTCSGVSC
jgi:hypothetical protein